MFHGDPEGILDSWETCETETFLSESIVSFLEVFVFYGAFFLGIEVFEFEVFYLRFCKLILLCWIWMVLLLIVYEMGLLQILLFVFI